VRALSVRLKAVATICLLWSWGCGAKCDRATARYLRDRTFRRSALVASLVNPNNAYSRTRLARYATGDERDWDRAAVWNPRVVAVRSGDLGGRDLGAADPGERLVADPNQEWLPDDGTLRQLGELAFFNYPVQLAPRFALNDEVVAQYGLWVDARRGVGGLVFTEMADGTRRIEFTCATCHADRFGSQLLAGAPNGHVDIGKMYAEAGERAGASPAASAGYRAWGPGRVDVTTADGGVPERMADLRPIRWASHLHYDATLRQQGVVSLAIRIETLIITSKNGALRPPRIIALALAVYLWSLADTLPPVPAATAGAKLFAEHCGDCHAGPDLGGGPVSLAVVGTDPVLGRSPERGTGAYRAAALRGLAARATLLHDGTLTDVSSLLDPRRLDASYLDGARGPGPVRGHPFGLELDEPARRALVAYLRLL
jgi:mono/diheme cytochrome c family protein